VTFIADATGGCLFGSEYSAPITAALWATIASVAASFLLLSYTVELRIQRRFRERRRARVIARWRTIIGKAVTGAADGRAPPSLPRRQRAEVLRLWNYTRSMIEGAAADRLIALAVELGLREFARKQARQAHLGTRLTALQALGRLRDCDMFDEILAATDDDNTLVAITAAEALAEIDSRLAVAVLIPKLAQRRDWPRTHVFSLLEKAGSAVISEPLYRCIRAASDTDAAYLLQFAEIAEFDVRDALAVELLRSRSDAELLAAALKVASGYGIKIQLDAFLDHPVWYVRMQAAALLGRMGRAEDVDRLEKRLSDQEWWVRYRAAKALVALPTLTRQALEEIRSRLRDPYACDVLEQAMAEAAIR
jgi:HEAT repeat protein